MALDEARATLAAKIRKAIDGLDMADKTKWNDLCPASDTATADYLACNSGVHLSVASMVCLFCARSDNTMAKGALYPFVFGNQQTNGLLSAARFLLQHTCQQMFISGNSPEACLEHCPVDTDLFHYLSTIVCLSDAAVTKSEANAALLYGEANARMHMTKDTSLRAASAQMARIVFGSSLRTDTYALSTVVKASVRHVVELEEENSRLAEMLRQILVLELKACKTLAVEKDKCVHRDFSVSLTRIAEQLKLPVLNFTAE